MTWIPSEEALLTFNCYQQLVLGNSFGNLHRPYAVLIGLWLLIGIGVTGGFFKIKLITTIYPDRLSIRFYPIHSSEQDFHPFNQIERVEPVTYGPILQYGGWGIRVGWGWQSL